MFSTALVLALSAAASATNLFVSSYAGTVTSLSLSVTNGAYTLTPAFSNDHCAPNSSWLTIDAKRGLLFCLNEGLTTTNGSLSSFTINDDGSLAHVKTATTISGPVNSVIYGNAAGKRAIALSHYSGSAVTSWFLNGGGQFSFNEEFTFTLSVPGAVPARQDAPHEHQAITDPTGQYLLVPDLGADLVRVFAIDPVTMALTVKTPLQVPAGSGPRHAAFYNPYGVSCVGCTTYLHIANELASTVSSYAVQYEANGGGLSFQLVQKQSTLSHMAPNRINAPAEIQISPDNRYLIISNRNSTLFSLPNPDGKNKTLIPSDSLSTFALNHDGTLTFVQLAPSVGLYPRHFSMNVNGTLIAVGNQNSGNVAILQRNVSTGFIGEAVANVPIEGQVTSVVWDESRA